MRVVRIVLLSLVLLPVLPGAASACAVCFDTTAENRMAFMVTTVILSLLPLGMVGGAGVWLRKRSREQDEQERGEQPSP
jgi:hypothetical protein